MAMHTSEEHGLLDVVTNGMLETLAQEIEDRPDLAALLDPPANGGDDTTAWQIGVEASLWQLVNGGDSAIRRARAHLDGHRGIRVCPATVGVLQRSGINPIGAIALAHARGPETADGDMMPTRIRIHAGPAAGLWARITHVVEGEVETVGMDIPLARGFEWSGWGPHLSHRSEYDLPSTLVIAVAGRRLGDVIAHDALDGDIVIRGARERSGTIALELPKHDRTVGWLLEQRYAPASGSTEFERRMDAMTTLLTGGRP